MQLLDHLRRLEAEGAPIHLGLVGCGQEGSGMVHVTNQMAGLETTVIADIDLERPRKTFANIGVPVEQICVTNKLARPPTPSAMACES